MKHTLHKLLALTTAGLLLPSLALAHPGHFAFDPMVAPHGGHEGEIAILLFGVFALAGLALHRRAVNRR
jgi:hypothetical protein